MKYSKLPRIYIKDNIEINKSIKLDHENFNYLQNVMRIKNGFNIRVYNEINGEYIASVKFDQKTGIVEILEHFRSIIPASTKLILFASIIKRDKFELICDMATQLGVTRIVPIITERVQKKEINIDRLEKIIVEAARQSERLDIPKLQEPIYLAELEKQLCDIIFFANETEQNLELKKQNGQKIGVLIGPEGGFSDCEIKFLSGLDYVSSISLGSNVLRTETAVVAMLGRLI